MKRFFEPISKTLYGILILGAFLPLFAQALEIVDGATYTLQQVATGRYLDAYEHDNDHRTVTRPDQDNDTQKWFFRSAGAGLYTIQQVRTARYLDAYEDRKDDYSLVTRPNQNNLTQKWLLIPTKGDRFTIQQAVNQRFLDAYEDNNDDFDAVTRKRQNNTTQEWRLKRVAPVKEGLYAFRQQSSIGYLDTSNEDDSNIVTRK